MNILVVEDNSAKFNHIVKALSEVPGCRVENIEQAVYATEAKRKLKATAYDLLLLDIAIPDRPDQLPAPEGGIGLLQEIIDRDTHYFRPKHIVGLTAFPEILTKVAGKFSQDLWMVIQYEAASSDWAERLKRKVAYILLAERSQPVQEYGLHLGIVAALHQPELTKVLDTVPWNWEKHQFPGDASTYFKGTLRKDDKTLEVIAVAAPRMGIAAASIAATKLIMSFRPRYLAMVGIAAGVNAQCRIGDIVVADPSWDWGSGKIISSGRFQQAPHQIGLDSFVRSKLTRFEQDGAALDSIRRGWSGPPLDNVLRIHIGPVASGHAVLADKKAVAQVVKQHRKLLAIDMETYGVYSAAEESPLPQPTMFSLKSVCDFGDKKKNDDFQDYAAYTSAQALRVFVEHFL